MKERLSRWWERVSSSGFLWLLADDAGKVRRGFVCVFGSRWFGARFVVVSFVVSAALTSAILVASFLSWHRNGPFLSGYGPYFLFFVPPNAIFNWLSVAVTLFFLKRMESSQSLTRLLLFMVADILLAVGLALAVVFVATGIGWQFEYVFAVDPEIERQLDFRRAFEWLMAVRLNLEYLLLHYRAGWTLADASLLVILFTGSLPTIVHLSVAIAFIGSKLFRPIAEPVVSRLVFAFCDSKQGIATQIAVALGVLGGVLQAAARLL